MYNMIDYVVTVIVHWGTIWLKKQSLVLLCIHKLYITLAVFPESLSYPADLSG
jgi:hypothetical protein